MDVQERIRRCLLLEEMKQHKNVVKRHGLKDTSVIDHGSEKQNTESCKKGGIAL
ncbi:MAG: hypothetical protein K6B68_14805 [Eubacterium sp.]|nr:hypothetical protein [Eubacterium sp.]